MIFWATSRFLQIWDLWGRSSTLKVASSLKLVSCAFSLVCSQYSEQILRRIISLWPHTRLCREEQSWCSWKKPLVIGYVATTPWPLCLHPSFLLPWPHILLHTLLPPPPAPSPPPPPKVLSKSKHPNSSTTNLALKCYRSYTYQQYLGGKGIWACPWRGKMGLAAAVWRQQWRCAQEFASVSFFVMHPPPSLSLYKPFWYKIRCCPPPQKKRRKKRKKKERPRFTYIYMFLKRFQI